MKFLNKKTVALLALLSVTGYSFGHEFEVTNKTEKPLVVKVKTRMGGHKYGVIEPSKSNLFAFTGLLCLESIQAAEYDPTDKDLEGYALNPVTIQMAKDSTKSVMEKESTKESDKVAATSKKTSEVDTEKIEEASVALAGLSLCKNRKFVIIDTGKEATIDIGGGKKMGAGYNEMIATIEKGS